MNYEHNCELCGKHFTGGPAAKYCSECRPSAYLQRVRNFRARKKDPTAAVKQREGKKPRFTPKQIEDAWALLKRGEIRKSEFAAALLIPGEWVDPFLDTLDRRGYLTCEDNGRVSAFV